MKSLICALLLLGVCWGFPQTEVADDDDPYNEDEIIKIVQSSGTTWTAGRNFPDGTTNKDLKRKTGAILRKKASGVDVQNSCEIPELPNEFDVREKWSSICPVVNEIYDQGACGSCWAVSTAAAFTDRVCIATNGKLRIPASGQQVTSCCKSCVPLFGEGCNGGYPDRAWEYFRDTGLVTGGKYESNVGCQPYLINNEDKETPMCQNYCYNDQYDGKMWDDRHKAQDAFYLDYCTAMEEIYNHGPIVAGFAVYQDFPSYKSGVYQHVTGKELGLHAVRIIGWGEENGTPYWLVTNSWGENWGDNGTFKILRGINEVGIEGELTAGHAAY